MKTCSRHTERILRIAMALMIAVAVLFTAADIVHAADPVGEKADRLLSEMSTEEKLAQMMLVAMPQKKSVSVQKNYQFGGYILFGRDFARSTKKSLKKEISNCRNVSDIGMLIAVDEEGGSVVRASLYRKFRKSKFRSPQKVYKSGGYKGVTRDTRTKDRFLKSLGINCNLAPVADVAYRKKNFIYKRSFSTNAGKVCKYVKLTVNQMNADNMVSAMKHFPGYGNNGDTHGKVIRDKRSYLTFYVRDLRPFRTGIENGTDMIMMSHTIVNAFDKKRPVSLSPEAVRYLREEMGFDGVIITDGLAMKAVTKNAGSQGKAAVKAVQAGNDMICVTGSYRKTYEALCQAAEEGKFNQEQIDASVKRILMMKIRRGII